MVVIQTKKKEEHGLEELFEEGWWEQLSPFLHSESFKYIGKSLIYECRKLVEITPPFNITFRAFKECPWDKLHTVLLGQD